MDALISKLLDKESCIDESHIDMPSNSRLIYGRGTPKSEWMNWEQLKRFPALNIEELFPKNSRVVILSPHPDDEILGCAGLIQKLVQMKHELIVVAVSNGTASHPNSSKYTIKQLNQIRPQESKNALSLLAGHHQIQYIEMGLNDGEISHQREKFETWMSHFIKPNDVLISTFEKDGHPDHEALGAFSRVWANAHQHVHLQVMVWAWHWAKPKEQQIEWQHAMRLDLTTSEIALKNRAIQCFKSQIEPDDSTGAVPIVPPFVIDRILMPWELYFYVN